MPPPRDDGLVLFLFTYKHTKSVDQQTDMESEEIWTLSGKLDRSRGPIEGLKHGHMNSTGGT